MKDIRRTNRDESLKIFLLSLLFNCLDKSNAQLNLVTPVDPKLVNNNMLYEQLKVNYCIQIVVAGKSKIVYLNGNFTFSVLPILQLARIGSILVFSSLVMRNLQTHLYRHFQFSGFPHICEHPFDIAGSDYRPTLQSLSRDSFFVSL